MAIEFTIKVNLGPVLEAIDAGAIDGLEQALVVIADAAKALAPEGESNMLKRSIQPGTAEGSFLDSTLEGTVLALAPYAAFVEFGTGEKGESGFASGKKYPIVPVRRKWLRFDAADGEGVIFSKRVMHPGVKARPYMRPALVQNIEQVINKVSAAIELAVDKVESS